jgi:hypothetical protein
VVLTGAGQLPKPRRGITNCRDKKEWLQIPRGCDCAFLSNCQGKAGGRVFFFGYVSTWLEEAFGVTTVHLDKYAAELGYMEWFNSNERGCASRWAKATRD